MYVPYSSLKSVHYREDVLTNQVNLELEGRLQEYCKKVLLPSYLDWMRSLQSLAIHRGGNYYRSQDNYIAMILKWILEEENFCLRRLLVDDRFSHNTANVPYRNNLAAPSVTSFCVGNCPISGHIDITNQRFHQIQHLTGVEFTRLAELPHLKYAFRGKLNDPNGITVLNYEQQLFVN